jgi:hypothetical protein
MHSTTLLMALLLCGLCCAQTPAPLVELHFGGSGLNSGSLRGEAVLTEYVAGEGPGFAPGVSGPAMSLERASRSGGSSLTEKSGGAAVFTDDALKGLKSVTLCLWAFPRADDGPARMMYLPGLADLMLNRGQIGLKLESGGKDFPQPTPSGAPALPRDRWSFVAATVDAETHTAVVYLGAPDAELRLVAEHKDVPDIGPGAGFLEVGNLRGIRPFKGIVDEARLYDRTLSAEELGAIMRGNCRPPRSLQSYVAPRQAPEALPLAQSDVCFSTRWARPNGLETARSFGANRIVWLYSTDAKYYAQAHAEGMTVQGAINSIPRVPDLSAYCVDLDGTPLVAPWMRSFSATDPPKWGCNNQPAFREAVLKQAFATLDAGADWMQFDDGWLIVSAHNWGGGCFCDRCMEAFAAYLRALPPERLTAAGIESAEGFDYRKFLAEKHNIRDAKTYLAGRATLPSTPLFEDFQRRSVREYFTQLRAQLDEHAGRRVPLTLNTNFEDSSQRNQFLMDILDGATGETWRTDLASLAVIARSAEALHRHQIVSPFPHNVADTRLALASTYALGEFYLVPWDIWMGAGTTERHFGTVEQYGDMYSFIRSNRALFDGLENPGMVGVVVDTDHFQRDRLMAVVTRLLKARVPFGFAFAGGTFYRSALDAERLSRFALLVETEDRTLLRQEDQDALAKAAESVPAVSDRELSDALLQSLCPISVWGPEDVVVLPRLSGKPEDRSLVCHVLNRLQAGADRKVTPLRYVSVSVRPQGMLGSSVASARWFTPGHEAVDCDVDELPDGPRIILPRIDEWGILKVDFAP